MGKIQWFFVVLVGVMFTGAAYAFGAEPATAAEVGGIGGALAGLGGNGVFGGVLKGIVAGIGRSLYGYHSDPAEDKQFTQVKFIATLLSGAIAGGVSAYFGMPFDNIATWIATYGGAEIIQKGVRWFWTKFAGEVVGEAVTRHLSRSMSPSSKGICKKG